MKPVRPQKYSPFVIAPIGQVAPKDVPTIDDMKINMSDEVRAQWARIEETILNSRESKHAGSAAPHSGTKSRGI